MLALANTLAASGALQNPIARGLAELRKFGADAHLYLPGIGAINGITAGNYLDSIGTTVASVDDLVGLVLDAAGSVGPELVTTPSIAAVGIGGPAFTNYSTGASVVAGKTYKISYTISGYSGSGNVGFAGTVFNGHSAGTDNGTYVNTMAATGSGAAEMFSRSTNTCQFSGITVKEITGIHATQATTGNKPTLRRGIVNLLTWSNDFTKAAWVPTGATVSGNTLTNVAGGYIEQNKAQTSKTATAAFWVRGVGATIGKTSRVFIIRDDYAEYSSIDLTLTAEWQLQVINFTFSVAPASTLARVDIPYPQVAGEQIQIQAAGLFQGTLTAEQILAAGGIPLTTTAPASSNVGAYAWEFDGSNDYLALGGVPFQQSDDHAVVVAFRCNSASGWKGVFEQRNTGVTGPKAPALEFAAGNVYAYYQDDAGLAIAPNVPMGIGEAGVVSVRKKSNTRSIRKNAGAWSSDSTILGTTTINSSLVGASGFGPTNFFNGSMWLIAVIKGTVSDAQLLIFERMINALSGYAAGRF